MLKLEYHTPRSFYWGSYSVRVCDEPGALKTDVVLLKITAKCQNDQSKTSHEGERYVKMPKNLRPVPNVVLLPCRTQMNLARQWHGDSTVAVSNVEPNT